MLENLLLGVQTAFSLQNLLFSFLGVFVGNLIGVLPGIGALAAISMLLPITYGLSPASALMMLAGIYYGTSFGGATTSILLNLPGTESHAVVCLDGHPLAKQGRAGPAIFMAMFASFVGVSVGIVLMAFFSPLLSDAAIFFGPEEYFSLMMLGLLSASALTTGSPLKGVASVIIGLIFGLVGTDVNSGVSRFTFGSYDLLDGLSLVALAMGLFGVVDIFQNAGSFDDGTLVTDGKLSSRAIRPSAHELRSSVGPISRGTAVGSLLGALPGTGATIAAFLSYALEKKISRSPERFGHGAIEGIASPEAANSSASITAFIPTLTLGIPGSAVMALMLGALLIQNVAPGPDMIRMHPDLFWGLIISFWLGNFLLMVLNIPLIGLWVKMLAVPYRIIFPIVLFLICLGVYSANNSLFDVGQVLVIGVFGYVCARLDFQPAPILLGFVLGPMVEENFRRALVLSRGDLFTFIERPVSGVCVAICLAMLGWAVYKSLVGNVTSRGAIQSGLPSDV